MPSVKAKQLSVTYANGYASAQNNSNFGGGALFPTSMDYYNDAEYLWKDNGDLIVVKGTQTVIYKSTFIVKLTVNE